MVKFSYSRCLYYDLFSLQRVKFFINKNLHFSLYILQHINLYFMDVITYTYIISILNSLTVLCREVLSAYIPPTPPTTITVFPT